MFGLSPMELVICLVVIVLLFGTKKLPELGAGLGEAISNFRKSYKDGLAIDVTPKDGAGQKTSESEIKKP